MNKSQKKTLKEIGKVALIALTTLFAIGIWASWDSEPEYSGDFSQTIRSNFMSECNADGNYYSYCNCTFNYIDSRTTNSGWVELEFDYARTEEAPLIMEEAIIHCIDLL